MAGKPTYEEMKQRVKELWEEATERKRAEEALKESEQRFRELADLLPQPVFELDLEGNFTYSNRCGFETFGYSHKDLADGVNALELFIPEERQRVWQNIQKRLAGKEFEDHEYTGLKKDGSTFPMLVYSDPIVAKNKMVGVRGIVLDISERKRTEEALRQREKELSAIYENAPLIMLLVDRERRVVKMNALAVSMARRSEEEAAGLRGGAALRCVHALDDPNGCGFGPACETCGVRNTVLKTLRTGEAFHRVEASLSYEHPDGPIDMHVLVSTTSMRLRQEEFVLVCLEDITERKRTQQELQKTHDELEQRVQERTKELTEINEQLLREIEERKQAEQNLQEAEAELKHTIEVVPGIIAKANAHTGYFTHCNPALTSILGYSSEEFLARPFIEFIHPDDRQGTINEVEKQLKGSPVVRFENRYICKDGACKWLEWRATAADEKGVVYAAATDITERKQAEETLRDSRHMLQTVLDSTPSGIFWKDRDSMYLGGNRTWLEAVGLKSSEEVVGKSDYDFPWEKKQADSFREDDRIVMESGIPEYDIVETYLQADGTHAWAKTNKVPLRDMEGNIVGVLGTYEDITERKKAEEALRDSENRLRLSLEGSGISFWEWFPQSGGIHFDVHWAKILGFEPEEKVFDFEWWNESIHPDSKSVFEKALHDYLEGSKPRYELEYRIKTKAGEWKWIWAAGECVEWDKNKKPVRFLGTHRDITERKLAEEALKQYSERLEEMVEERTKKLRDAQEQLVRREKLVVLGQVAGGLAHELRNPLGAIRNSSYFLNMALKDPEPEVKEALGILEKEVVTSESIIRGILDFTRREAPVRRKVDVNDILQAALSRVPVPKSVEFVSQLNETLPIIPGDPEQLTQAFRNLIRNAVQAMPGGGQLAVRFEAPSPECVTVSFTDTGAGMDEETLGKVFEPLFTTKAKGIGLGLALTKMVIETHGGTIDVESEVGKGSTFTVRLPVG